MRSLLIWLGIVGDGVGAMGLAALVAGIITAISLVALFRLLYPRMHWYLMAMTGLLSGCIPLLSMYIMSYPSSKVEWVEGPSKLVGVWLEKTHLDQTMVALFVYPWVSSFFLWPLIGLMMWLGFDHLRQSGNKPKKIVLPTLTFTMLTSVVANLAFWGVLLSLLYLGSECSRQTDTFHLFNGHLKDVCWRVNMSECPRSVEQLKAFEPSKYEELKACAQVSYAFDERTMLYEWRAKMVGESYTMIGSQRFEDGYGVEW